MESALRELDIFNNYNREYDHLLVYDRSFDDIEYGIKIFCIISLLLALYVLFTPKITRNLVTESGNISSDDLVSITLRILVRSPCYFLHLDVLDSIGHSQLHVNDTIKFGRYNRDLSFLGYTRKTNDDSCFSCFGLLPEGYCCNSCEQLILFHKRMNMTYNISDFPQCNPESQPDISLDEICSIYGHFNVNRVEGSFHIAPGHNINPDSRNHYHDVFDSLGHIDLSHRIDILKIGPDAPFVPETLSRPFYVERHHKNFPKSYHYNLIVSPVAYSYDNYLAFNTYEYTHILIKSPASAYRQPGIYFSYSFTPYSIDLKVTNKSLIMVIVKISSFFTGIFFIFSLVNMKLNKISKSRQSTQDQETEASVSSNGNKQ